MSIANQITRLTTARNAIRTALDNKGIDASEHGFEDFADDINSISQQGGGTSPSGSLTITENDTYDVTEYAEVIVEVEGEVDPEYSIKVPTQQALGMIEDFFHSQGIYDVLNDNQIMEWNRRLEAIFNME